MIWMAAILVIAVAAAGFLLFLGMDYLGVSLSSDSTVQKEIVIEQGTSAKMVAEKLKDSGVIKKLPVFQIICQEKRLRQQIPVRNILFLQAGQL